MLLASKTKENLQQQQRLIGNFLLLKSAIKLQCKINAYKLQYVWKKYTNTKMFF